jgi:DNA-binding LytR/AlgR family response regulator
MDNFTPSILVLDDELPALSYMVETIEEIQQTELLFKNFTVLSTSRQTEFWELITKFLPTIIFLDIQMPIHSGIEIAKLIRDRSIEFGYKENFPLIIFSTAFENYGYQAFQVEAIDYLLKPTDREKIIHTFHKIKDNYPNISTDIIDSIKVPTNGIEIDLPLKEVIYFHADMKYITVVTDKKDFLINTTLVNLENLFPKFIKIHRSYLVNPFYILKFFKKDNNWYLSLKNSNKHLPVSRRQKQEIEGKLNYHNLFENDV